MRRGAQANALVAIDHQHLALKADRQSRYYQVLQRLAGTEAAASALPRWLAPATAGALALMLGAFGWVATLRRQVAARTAEVERLYEGQREHALQLEHRVAQRTEELARRPFDLRASLERVAGIARPLAEAKALALRVELDPALGSAVGDARRVEQVLLNLLSNAVKFTERGEVTLRAEPATLPGEQGSTVKAVRIAVADTGIRDEDLELLFRPFRQIDSRLARQHEGTGLGLAICRRLCDAMGGTIQVQSRWQHGSTFVVTLPLQAREP